MGEVRVVQDLAEACSSVGETYGAWTTAKAVVQRRYLSSRAQGTFSGCAEYLTSITDVLRRHLRVDLARELIDDVLFQAVDHFARKAAASPSGSAPSERMAFAAAAANFLQRLFDSLITATVRTYTLTGPLPLKVGWYTGNNVDGVEVAAVAGASGTAAALQWADGAVLHFTLRAVATLDSLLPPGHDTAASSAICAPWVENLFVAYEQLLALRLSCRQTPTSASAPRHAGSTTSSTPTKALVAPLLGLSAISSRSRAAMEGGHALASEGGPPSHSPNETVPGCTALSQADTASPTPAVAAVYWITHFAARPEAVNHLFAQYLFHDVLHRGMQSSEGSAVVPSVPSASTVQDSAVAVLQSRCPLQRREALAVARTAIAAYQQALPLVLQRYSSAPASVATRTTRAEAETPGVCDSTEYVQHYTWTWFLDSLVLTLQYGGATPSTGGDADTLQRARHEQVCAQVLDTYASVVAELPGLQWPALIAAYAAAP